MPNNLDQRAMLTAGEILQACAGMEQDDVVNVATQGAGVVLEQGLYAGLLYFYASLGKRPAAKPHAIHLLKLARSVVPQANAPDALDPLPNLDYLASSICVNLHRTILVKTLWEQTLTYVRYGAKALKKAHPAPDADASADPKDENVAG